MVVLEAQKAVLGFPKDQASKKTLYQRALHFQLDCQNQALKAYSQPDNATATIVDLEAGGSAPVEMWIHHLKVVLYLEETWIAKDCEEHQHVENPHWHPFVEGTGNGN